MRNKELIQEVYEICLDANISTMFGERIIELIEKERPELIAYKSRDNDED